MEAIIAATLAKIDPLVVVFIASCGWLHLDNRTRIKQLEARLDEQSAN